MAVTAKIAAKELADRNALAEPSRAPVDTGWLLEIQTCTGPMWLCVSGPHLIYTDASLQALRFGRRCDAEAYREWADLGETVRATEHNWK